MIRLLEMNWLHGLWAIPAAALILFGAAWLRRRALRRFYGEAAGRPWAGRSGTIVRAIGGAMLMVALGALVLALARPAYNPKPQKTERTGRDLVFLIDVSRSMLAQDLRPSRLERAKLAVRDVLDAAQGDRVAIVAFAGTAVVRCPLTTDYSFARQSLDDLSPDSVSRGGTAIGDAIRTAMSQLFDEDKTTTAADNGRFRDIFLLTDGEDHESFPVEAAQQAGQRGVRIVAIGLGSEIGGALVPASGGPGPTVPASQFVEYEGKRVQSRLDPETLRRVASATPGGVFLNVGTGNIELDRVYLRLVRDAERRRLDSTEAVRYTEAFQWFIGLALLALFAESFISGKRN